MAPPTTTTPMRLISTLVPVLLARGGAGAAARSSTPNAPHDMSAFTRWFSAAGGVASPKVEMAPSTACGGGLGLFATEDLAARELLGEVPVSACLSAEAALNDPELGNFAAVFLQQQDGARAAEAVVLAALIARARYAPSSSARRAWGEYVDMLPWGDGGPGGEDSLRNHPLVLRDDETLGEHMEDARVSAEAVHAILTEAAEATAGEPAPTEAQCYRAVVIVASRSFDMSTAVPAARPAAAAATAAATASAGAAAGSGADGAERAAPSAAPSDGERSRVSLSGFSYVMVPFFDCLNHPSESALRASGEAGARFRKHGILDACVRWRARPAAPEKPDSAPDSGEVLVSVHAPNALPVCAGDQLWQWYGNAGWGHRSPDAWLAEERLFVAQYGFNPWV